jgi:hypothetical protein
MLAYNLQSCHDMVIICGLHFEAVEWTDTASVPETSIDEERFFLNVEFDCRMN